MGKRDQTDRSDRAGAVPAVAADKRGMPQRRAKRIEDLLQRAQRGDGAAMHALQPLFEQADAWEDVAASPTTVARRAILAAGIQRDLLLRAAWERRAARLQAELAGEHPSPLERLLCERAATCWLDVCLAEIALATGRQRSVSPKEGEFHQRSLDRAHARYLASLQSIAKVRRLLTPVVAQVNIAQPGAQQLNVAMEAQPEVNLLSPGTS